jgi:hypothetical protein
MFNVRRSSLKTTLYGRVVTCECLQNNLALMGFIPARIIPNQIVMTQSPKAGSGIAVAVLKRRAQGKTLARQIK